MFNRTIPQILAETVTFKSLYMTNFYTETDVFTLKQHFMQVWLICTNMQQAFMC